MKKIFFSLAILSVAACLSAQTTMPDFSKLGYKKPVMYASKMGGFEEFHDQADVVEIGTVLFNTKTNQVVGFLSEEEVEADVSSATTAMSIDPHCERYPWITPYAYCLNNPVRLVDMDGRDPGDPFKTILGAAKDWGRYYNGASILRGKEFASTIYKTTIDGKAVYTYSEANIGESDIVKFSKTPNGEATEALIHSHGQYDEGYINNDFSNKDKWNSYNNAVDGYVATPDGSLKKYDPHTTNTTVVCTDLPSDPKDPDRKNKVDPTDVPMEKKRVQTTAEQDKKPEVKIPESERNKLQWAF